MWIVSKPSNIALIKYMGKKTTPSCKNLPCNASLSYGLSGLRSVVVLEPSKSHQDVWKPLTDMEFEARLNLDKSVIKQSHSLIFKPTMGAFSAPMPLSHLMAHPFQLSTSAQKRFLSHLAYVKSKLGCETAFVVRSGNNFPADCGLASSASSFAALTHCAVLAISHLGNGSVIGDKVSNLSNQQIAQLSRQGSGSSCRSFFSPWAIWQDETVSAIDLPYAHLIHCVIILDEGPKQVTSSQAHQRVKTSPLFVGRAKRAKQRLNQLINRLRAQDWTSAFGIVWDEFKDMQALFMTATPAFDYSHSLCLKTLDYLLDYWHNEGDGPLVTLDAGPNIHLLFRQDQANTHLKTIQSMLPSLYE